MSLRQMTHIVLSVFNSFFFPLRSLGGLEPKIAKISKIINFKFTALFLKLRCKQKIFFTYVDRNGWPSE